MRVLKAWPGGGQVSPVEETRHDKQSYLQWAANNRFGVHERGARQVESDHLSTRNIAKASALVRSLHSQPWRPINGSPRSRC